MKRLTIPAEDIEELIIKWKSEGLSEEGIFVCFLKAAVFTLAANEMPLLEKRKFLKEASIYAKNVVLKSNFNS
jgi:hypothetical protein